MRLIISILIIIFLACGCKKREVHSEQLSKIIVVRQPDKHNYIQTNSQIIPKNTPCNPIEKGKYHIIVASFQKKDKASAESLVFQLKKQKHNAILIESTNRYRVSIKSFSNESEANKALPDYKNITHRDDIWILKE